MKKATLVVSLTLIIASNLLAADRRNNLVVNLGVGVPLTDLDLTDQGGGKDKIGKTGATFGLQYLYDVSPQLGLGADINGTAFGENASDVLIPGGHTTTKPTSSVYLAAVKFKFIPAGQVQPYVLGGFGFHRTSLDAKTAPQAGFVWADTGTRETRQMVDDSQTNYALAIGGGLDFPINDTVFMGVEGRYQHLGEVTFSTTPSAVQTFGVTSVKGPMNMFNFLAKAGFKF